MKFYRADEELVFLGYHLMHKLWKTEQDNVVYIDSKYGRIIDRNYYPLKAGYSDLVSNESDPLLVNQWRDTSFELFTNELKRLKLPQITDIIFHLLDWSGRSRSDVVKGINKTKNKTISDGKLHSLSVPAPSDFGICFISIPDGNTLLLSTIVLEYSIASKYRNKCDAWLGIGAISGSPNLVDYVVFNNTPWISDRRIDNFSNELLKNGLTGIIFSSEKRLNRNDRCLCGSGIKFKKCCDKM